MFFFRKFEQVLFKPETSGLREVCAVELLQVPLLIISIFAMVIFGSTIFVNIELKLLGDLAHDFDIATIIFVWTIHVKL